MPDIEAAVACSSVAAADTVTTIVATLVSNPCVSAASRCARACFAACSSSRPTAAAWPGRPWC